MKYTCKRCGHEWITRIETKPRTCAKCKSYKWDEAPKKRRPVK
jgi:predicted Zn-ribbon and HTH transcriptional regulator